MLSSEVEEEEEEEEGEEEEPEVKTYTGLAVPDGHTQTKQILALKTQ